MKREAAVLQVKLLFSHFFKNYVENLNENTYFI